MSLSAQEQQALDAIEDGLAGAAPELARLLITFDRLTSGEEMPARERIRPTRWQAAGHAGPRLRQGGRRLGRKQTLLVWLIVAVSLLTVVLMLNRSARQGACPRSRRAVCAGEAFAGEIGLVMPPGLIAAGP